MTTPARPGDASGPGFIVQNGLDGALGRSLRLLFWRSSSVSRVSLPPDGSPASEPPASEPPASEPPAEAGTSIGAWAAALAPTTALPLPEPPAGQLLAEVERLLSGAVAARVPIGGFGWLDDAGVVDPSAGRPLWITTRMTHCFSIGALLAGDRAAQYGELADHGVQALLGAFRDAEHGGWFSELGGTSDAVPGGLPGSGPVKGAYGHAFVVLAGSSATVAGRPGGAELLAEALRVQEEHFWDDAAGAVVEEWDRAWTTCDPYRGANANMHTVEAYLAASDATGDPLWRHRALRIATRLVENGARRHDWRLPEHFDAAWVEQPEYNRDAPAHPFRPFGVTPGHGLEWSRLLLHLEASLGVEAPNWLRPAAIGLFDRALADGWDDVHGGICYTTDWAGAPVVQQHFHWVVCEGIAAAVALHRATGEQRFADWYGRLWDYAQRVFITDGVPGWLHEANPDGTPSTVTWTGRPDIYHALQATLIPVLPRAPGFPAAVAASRP